MVNPVKIRCELCNQEISKSNYSKHLRRHRNHPESFESPKYRVDHDGLQCQFCGKECKNSNSLRNHERLCKDNPDKQLSSFIEYNKNVQKGNRSVWNKGLTKETDVRVLRSALKRAGKSGLKGGLNPSKRADVRKKISESCLKRSSEGTWHTSLAKDHHIQYKGQDFHSTWEVAYAKYLDTLNIKWERAKQRFLYVYKNKNHYYTPDFYLPDTDEYVEIKGYRTGKDYAKWKQFPSDKKLRVLFGKDLLALGIDVKL